MTKHKTSNIMEELKRLHKYIDILSDNDVYDIEQFIEAYYSAADTLSKYFWRRISEFSSSPAVKEALSVSETAAQVVEDKTVGGVDLA